MNNTTSNSEKFYTALKNDGSVKLPKTFEQFDATMKDNAKRNQFYNALKESNRVKLPDTYNEFETTLGYVTPQIDSSTYRTTSRLKAEELGHLDNVSKSKNKGYGIDSPHKGFGVGTTGVPYVSLPKQRSASIEEPLKVGGNLGYKNDNISQTNERLEQSQLDRDNLIDNIGEDFDKLYNGYIGKKFDDIQSDAVDNANINSDNSRRFIFGGGASFGRELGNAVVNANITDSQKLIEKTFEELDPKIIESFLQKRVMKKNPKDDKEYITLYESEAEKLSNDIQNKIAQKYINESTTKNDVEYILSGALNDNILSKIISGTVRAGSGSSGMEQSLRDATLQEYGKDTGILTTVGKNALELIIDAPAFYIGGKFGGIVGKGIIKGIGKAYTKKIAGKELLGKLSTSTLKGVGERLASNSYLGTALSGSASMGTTLGAYDMMKTGANQYSSGDYDGLAILKDGAHGAMMGSILGALGNTTKYLTRGSGKVVKATTDIGSFGLESAIFAVPSIISRIDNGEVLDLNDVGKEFAVSALTLLAVKASKPKEFVKSIKQRYNSPNIECKFTQEEKDNLEQLGYHSELNTLLHDISSSNPIAPDYKWERGDDGNMIIKQSKKVRVKDGTDMLQEYENLMQNPNVLMSTKAKCFYLIEGGATQAPAILSSKLVKNENGYVVDAIGRNGIIERKYFVNEKDAQELHDKQNDTAQRNSINGLEKVCDIVSERANFANACENVANEILLSDGEKVTPADVYNEFKRIEKEESYNDNLEDKALYNAVKKEINKTKVSAIRDKAKHEVFDDTGIDVDKALSKSSKTRSEVENSAIKTYVEKLNKEIGKEPTYKPKGTKVLSEEEISNFDDPAKEAYELAQKGEKEQALQIYEHMIERLKTYMSQEEYKSLPASEKQSIDELYREYNEMSVRLQNEISLPTDTKRGDIELQTDDITKGDKVLVNGDECIALTNGYDRVVFENREGKRITVTSDDVVNGKFTINIFKPIEEPLSSVSEKVEQDKSGVSEEEFISSLLRDKNGNIDYANLSVRDNLKVAKIRLGEESSKILAEDELNRINDEIALLEKKYKVSLLSERLSIIDRINELKRDAKSILEMYPRENAEVVAETAPIEEKVESSTSEVAPAEIVPIGRGVFGDIYDQFRGKAKEAFDFLIKHKSGDLLGVFHRDGIGDIDLVWGDEKNSNGLGHIIDKHIKQHNDFANIDDAVRVIDDVISNGAISRENRDKIVLEKDGYRVVVGKQIRDNHGNIVDNKNWVITSFDKSRSQIEKTSSEKTLTAPLSDREADGVTLPSNEVSGSKDKKEVGENQDKDNNFGVAVTEADKADVVTEEFGQGDDGKIYRKASDTEIKASDEESREAEDIRYRSGESSPASDAEIGEAVRIGKSLGMEVEVVNEPSSENAGYYDTKTGQIVVNSAKGGDGEAVKTVLHEVVGHKGLVAVLGEKADTFFGDVYDIIGATEQRKIYELYKDSYGLNADFENISARDKRLIAQEYCATVSEGDIYNPTTLNKIRDFMVKAFRAVGINVRLSDRDVQMMLRKSRKYQERQAIVSEEVNKLPKIEISSMKGVSATEAVKVMEVYSDAQKYIDENGIKSALTIGRLFEIQKSGAAILGKAIGEQEAIHQDVLNEINGTFNEKLVNQINGTVDATPYKLGMPSGALLYSGVSDLPIEMIPSTLALKSSNEYKSNHPFDLSDIKDLPASIQRPIAVFDSEELNGKKIILTELTDKKGHNFVAVLGLKQNRGRNSIEINNIISLYPKNGVAHVAKWFDSTNNRGLGLKDDLLLWADTKKASQWLSNNSSYVNLVGLSPKRIANKIKSFDTPAIQGVKNDLLYRKKNKKSTSAVIEANKKKLHPTRGLVTTFADSTHALRKLQEGMWEDGTLPRNIDMHAVFNQAPSKASYIINTRGTELTLELQNSMFKMRKKLSEQLDINRKGGWSHLRMKGWADVASSNKPIGLYAMAKTAKERQEKKELSVVEEHTRDWAGITGITRELITMYGGNKDTSRMNLKALTKYAKSLGYNDIIETYIKAVESTATPEVIDNFWKSLRHISDEILNSRLNSETIEEASYQRMMYGDVLEKIIPKEKVSEWKSLPFKLRNDSNYLLKNGYIKEVNRYYTHYLPLKGNGELAIEDNKDIDYKISEGSKTVNEMRGVQGHTHLAEDPFNNIVKDLYGTYYMSERNKALQYIADCISLSPSKDYSCGKRYQEKINGEWVDWSPLDSSGNIREYDDKGNAILTPSEAQLNTENFRAVRTISTVQEADAKFSRNRALHSVEYYDNGKANVMWFTELAVADGLNNRKGKMEKAFEAISNYEFFNLVSLNDISKGRAAFMTSLNPEFAVVNAPRDYFDSLYSSFSRFGIRYTAKLMKNHAKFSHSTVAKYLKNGKVSNDTEAGRYFNEFIENGALTSVTQMGAQLKDARDLYVEISRMESKDNKEKVAHSRKMWEWIKYGSNFITEGSEMLSRYSIYMTSRQMGRSKTESARDAKEGTVNFDSKGKIAGTGNSFIQLFFNATMQGTRRELSLWQAYDKAPGWDRISQRIRVGVADSTFLVVSSCLSKMAYGFVTALLDDSDDAFDEKLSKAYYEYENISREVKGRAIILPGDIRIPMPVSKVPLLKLGSYLSDYLVPSGKQNNAYFYNMEKRMAYDFVSDFIGTYGIESASRAFDLIVENKEAKYLPFIITTPAISPFMEFIANRNFTGGKLYDDSEWNEWKPSWEKDRGVSNFLATWLSKSTDDAIDTSLAKTIIDGYLPGVLHIPFELGDMIEKGTKAAPVIRRITVQGTADGREEIEMKKEFFYMFNELEKAENEDKRNNDGKIKSRDLKKLKKEYKKGLDDIKEDNGKTNNIDKFNNDASSYLEE